MSRIAWFRRPLAGRGMTVKRTGVSSMRRQVKYLNPIEQALQDGSSASFEVVRLPNLNHMFQETEGTGAPAEYGTIEETFSPKALNIISDWVGKVTR